MDELKAKHKTELKELQAKVQQMKHSVPKGDKKKKKQVMAEIALLEAQLEEKHRSEMQDLQHTMANSDEVSSNLAAISINENCGTVEQKKISRAQKRREKKEEEEKERQQRIAEAEVENATSARNLEAIKFNEIMSEKGFIVKEIAPDGNCLYNAIADQLTHGNHEWKTLRTLTAQTLRKEKERFIPFMTNPDTGGPFDEDEYDKYCEEVEKTNTWGGQVEAVYDPSDFTYCQILCGENGEYAIQALSSALGHPIEIFQTDAPILTIGEHLSGNPIRLSYHKHAYGLGEHYNSVVPKEE